MFLSDWIFLDEAYGNVLSKILADRPFCIIGGNNHCNQGSEVGVWWTSFFFGGGISFSCPNIVVKYSGLSGNEY